MDPLDLHAAQNLHLFIVQVAAQGGADLGLLLRCNPGSAFEHGHPDTEAVEELGELKAYRAPADHCQRFGQHLEVKRVCAVEMAGDRKSGGEGKGGWVRG